MRVGVAVVAALFVSGAWAGVGRAVDRCAATVGTVSGTVMAAGGGPLAGATVRVQGCLGDPVTVDAAGAFTLSVPSGPQAITASAAGYYIGCWKGVSTDCSGASAGDHDLVVTLDPLPADDDPAHVFRNPEACRECHSAIYEQWSRSSMAFTNRNRWVDNLYNGTDITMPAGPAPDPHNPPYFSFLASHNLDPANPTRNGECANCHQPEYVGTDPTNTNFNLSTGTNQHGIACDFCHKIVDVDVSPDGIKRPNLVVGDLGLPAKTTMLRSASEPWLMFGPLDDVTFPGVPDMRAAHGTVLQSSKVCAACHEDHGDLRDVNDDFTEEYAGPPSQTTYSEWAASDFAARGVQCQDCHMPPTGDDHFCDRTSNTRDPSQVRDHSFPGTTPEFLRSAVTLRSRSVVDGETLAVTVDVTNSGAGHDLPTGVTIRHLLLVVTPTTKDGETLVQLPREQSGGTRVPNWGGVGDVAKGNFAGLPGKGFARVLVDENLVENVLFTEAVSQFDNRLHAGATDSTTYRFALPKDWAKQDVRVATQLWYRRAFKPLADQRKWTEPGVNGNPNGTRGDGTDYDGGLVIAARHNLLTCRGKLAKLKGTATTDGGLSLTGVLKLPAKTAIDPVVDGAAVALGGDATTPAAVDELLAGFTGTGAPWAYASDATDTRSLQLTKVGKRGVKLSLQIAGLDRTVLAAKKVAFGLDSGDVCFRHTLRCKVVAKPAGTIRCR